MSDPDEDHAGQMLQVTVMDDEKTIEVWTKEGLSGAAVARLLRLVADGFDSGEVKRVR